MHLVARWERNTSPSNPSTIRMIINSTYMTVDGTVDGKDQSLDTAPYIKQDRTYVYCLKGSVLINDDQSVTITLDDENVTMMLGFP